MKVFNKKKKNYTINKNTAFYIKTQSENNNYYWICGKHSVIECSKNEQRIVKKIILSNHEYIKNFSSHLLKYIEIKNNSFFNTITKNQDIAHQGYAIQTMPLSRINLKNYMKTLHNIVALDGVLDPRNIGSIIRTSLAFNIDALIFNKREVDLKSISLNKAASGSIENIKIFTVSNILNEIENLKRNNFFIQGLDGHANEGIEKVEWNNKNVFIFGSESSGIRPLLKKYCDRLLKISINSKIESLNVSNSVSAALAIYNSKKITT